MGATASSLCHGWRHLHLWMQLGFMRARLALIACVVLAVLPPAAVNGETTVPLRACNPPRKARSQAFNLPALRVQWDSWKTSQLTTAVAAIILAEHLGFPVELVSGMDPYSNTADGAMHLAFEVWPASNPVDFGLYVGDVEGKAVAFPYTTLFGRSG